MARHRRRRRRAARTGTQLAQIIALTVVLVIILIFRTRIAENAGKFLNVFGDSEDVTVGAPGDDSPEKAESPAPPSTNTATPKPE